MADILGLMTLEGLTFISDGSIFLSDMNDIGSHLEALEAPKGLMAKEMGLSRSYLYDITSGKRQPTAPVVSRILAFLNRPENLRKLGRRRPVTFEETFGTSAKKQGRTT